MALSSQPTPNAFSRFSLTCLCASSSVRPRIRIVQGPQYSESSETQHLFSQSGVLQFGQESKFSGVIQFGILPLLFFLLLSNLWRFRQLNPFLCGPAPLLLPVPLAGPAFVISAPHRQFLCGNGHPAIAASITLEFLARNHALAQDHGNGRPLTRTIARIERRRVTAKKL